jgi:choline-sulfatase
MKSNLSRRDFLKLSSLLPLSLLGTHYQNLASPNQPNVLVIVFDAFSAFNIPVYGYPRNTTPNISRLAKRAIVYNNHHSGGNFTTPGTASLLTGVLPWKHRAFNLGGFVSEEYVSKSIFSAIPNYYKFAFSHNNLVDHILRQFKIDIDDITRTYELLLAGSIIPPLFGNDQDTFSVSWQRYLNRNLDGNTYSLFLSHLSDLRSKLIKANRTLLDAQFPRGLPESFNSGEFLLEDAIQWATDNLKKHPQPFMGYLHFLPPHDPYNTHRNFYNYFKDDDYHPTIKPTSIFTEGESEETLLQLRTEYDEFILYADREFGKLMDFIHSSELAENTWVILTSDHGEMFERGISGHRTFTLYEPVMRIPLMIFDPGRTERLDININTSAVDILPTLSHITGQKPVDWTEGVVLPPFSSSPNTNWDERDIYTLEAQKNQTTDPLSIATVSLKKGRYKLIYSVGYDELKGTEMVELYDVLNDPEELNDISKSQQKLTSEMLATVKAKLDTVNAPYL